MQSYNSALAINTLSPNPSSNRNCIFYSQNKPTNVTAIIKLRIKRHKKPISPKVQSKPFSAIHQGTRNNHTHKYSKILSPFPPHNIIIVQRQAIIRSKSIATLKRSTHTATLTRSRDSHLSHSTIFSNRGKGVENTPKRVKRKDLRFVYVNKLLFHPE